MNAIVYVAELLFFLCCVLICYKLFGKNGLYIFSIFGVILANIQVCLAIDILSIDATSGNALYAATFLITDILSEKYGKEDANKAVRYGFVILLMWVAGIQLTLLYTPSESDMAYPAMKELFSLIPRVTAGSIVAYMISQRVDIFLYHKIWDRLGRGKKGLWIRNNGSTLVSQLLDTIIFTTIAFAGIYDWQVFAGIMLSTYLFKAFAAIIDTPFIYLARRITPLDEKNKTA